MKKGATSEKRGITLEEKGKEVYVASVGKCREKARGREKESAALYDGSGTGVTNQRRGDS